MSGIYIHVPFCKQACHYCNFHFSTSRKKTSEMVQSICKEIALRATYLEAEQVETIYFGGGTPSLLTGEQLDQIFEAINQNFAVDDSAEITLEANPDDLTEEKLDALSKSSVNRLSIGVQSFFEDELRWMNRAHNAEESLRCIRDAKSFGFNSISLDLIFGIPGSSHDRWLENLEIIGGLRVPHISMYALTVEEGTALARWVAKGKEVEAADDYVMEQFDMGIDYLESHGYEHYEISNYSLPGKEARHNSNYWRAKPYLGIGPSAHSYNGRSRSMNIAHNIKYMEAMTAGLPNFTTELIDEKTRYNEYVMTRLRTSWGIELEEIGRFQEHFLKEVKGLLSRAWVEERSGIYRLTHEGKHFADSAAMELFID